MLPLLLFLAVYVLLTIPVLVRSPAAQWEACQCAALVGPQLQMTESIDVSDMYEAPLRRAESDAGRFLQKRQHLTHEHVRGLHHRQVPLARHDGDAAVG